MTVLVGGSFLAFAVRPERAAPATATLLIALASMLVSAPRRARVVLLGHAAPRHSRPPHR